jgi:Flp pilus assembly protein TadD
MMLSDRKTDEAVRNFKQALSIEPGHVKAAEMLAGIYKTAGRYDEAAALYKQLLDRKPEYSITITYNLACLFALKNDPATAMAWLNKSIAAGFTHFGLLAIDKDLDNIRLTPAFQELISSCGPGR